MPKVSVEVPEGMTPQRLLELLDSYDKRNVASKANREKRNAALAKLIHAHQAEYDGYMGKK